MRCWSSYKNDKLNKQNEHFCSVHLYCNFKWNKALIVNFQRALQDSVWSGMRYLAFSEMEMVYVVRSAEVEYIERSFGEQKECSENHPAASWAQRDGPSDVQLIRSRAFRRLRVHVNTQTREVQNQLEQSVNTSGIHCAATWPAEVYLWRKMTNKWSIHHWKHNFRGRFQLKMENVYILALHFHNSSILGA